MADAVEGPKSDDWYLEQLKNVKADWEKDQLGVRGNPVELHKEQAQTNWSESTFVSRGTQIKPAEPVGNTNRTELERLLTSEATY